MAPGQLDHTQLAFSVACRRWMQNVGATTTYEVKNRLLIGWKLGGGPGRKLVRHSPPGHAKREVSKRSCEEGIFGHFIFGCNF